MFVFPLLCLAASILTSHGFCMQDTMRFNITKDGKLVEYCEYNGHILLPGDHIRTDDCMECTCGNGLSCCGYGIKAGVVLPPKGCVVRADGCKMLIVKVDDESRDCFTGEFIVKV